MIVYFRGTREAFKRPIRSLRGWSLWSLNRPALALILCLEVAAVSLTTLALTVSTATSTSLVHFAVLAGMSVVYVQAADRVERLRRYLGSGIVFSDPTSIWAFAGVVVLPAGYAAALIAVVYGHTLIRSRRLKSLRPHRTLFTAATVVLATLVTSSLLDAAAGVGTLSADPVAALLVVAALIAYPATNLGLLTAGMYLAMRPPSIRVLLPSRDEVGFETATLVLGLLTAEVILHTPWLTPIVLVVVAVLHRSSLVKQLQTAAATDPKTGLLNATAWTDRARIALGRAAREGRSLAVLLIDLDRFKVVNDVHGHLVGDRVLHAVADCLRTELRGHDEVGRFGGEEFVAVVDGLDVPAATALADRLRTAIGSLPLEDGVRVTASIGLAHSQDAGLELEELLQGADAAMYEAKHAGRDGVRVAAGAASQETPTDPAPSPT